MTGPFVRLTLPSGRSVWVNLANATSIVGQAKDYDGTPCTQINLVGEDWVRVKETPDEILRRAMMGGKALPIDQIHDGVAHVGA